MDLERSKVHLLLVAILTRIARTRGRVSGDTSGLVPGSLAPSKGAAGLESEVQRRGISCNHS